MSRKILVTGGASGIGKAIAAAFLAAGDAVFICDLDRAALDRTAAELPGLTIGVCDIARRDQVATIMTRAAEALGGIDTLINNAGISGPTAAVQEMDPDAWEKVLQVNLTGTFNITRLCIPYLIRSENGVIINMSSAAGRFGYPNRGPYATTKWGLIGFTKTLSMELGQHNVRVNAILPGPVDGERVHRVFEGRAKASGQSLEEIRQRQLAEQSLRRLVDPADIAALAVFLASDAAKSISGQALPIDGDLQRN